MNNEKVQQAVKLIRSICQSHNVALAFSGGKGSVVLDYLAKEANVKVERFHNDTMRFHPLAMSCKPDGRKPVTSKINKK